MESKEIRISKTKTEHMHCNVTKTMRRNKHMTYIHEAEQEILYNYVTRNTLWFIILRDQGITCPKNGRNENVKIGE